ALLCGVLADRRKGHLRRGRRPAAARLPQAAVAARAAPHLAARRRNAAAAGAVSQQIFPRHARESGHPVITDLVVYSWACGYWIAAFAAMTTPELLLRITPPPA